MIGIASLCAAMAFIIRLVLARQNRALDRAEGIEVGPSVDDQPHQMKDQEEERKRNLRIGQSTTGAFRYLL